MLSRTKDLGIHLPNPGRERAPRFASRINVRHATRLTVAGLVLAALGAMNPGTTKAADWGYLGPVDAPYSVCQVGLNAKTVYVAVPTVYASNRTPGIGNDRQLVHYWTRLVDANSVPVTAWSHAGSAYANDNAPAQLPAYGKFNGFPYHGQIWWNSKWEPVALTWAVSAQYSVAWYDANGRAIGNSVHAVPGFHGWQSSNIYIGSAARC